MKKGFKTILSVLLVLCLFGLSGCQGGNELKKDVNATSGELSGKTVILHSNDVHGNVNGYAYMAQAKKDYEAKGATVILVDAGDFTQGTIYVSSSKGKSAVDLMGKVGYDIVTLGNHEFDYGVDQLKSNLEGAPFVVLCSNVFEGDKTLFEESKVVNVGGLKVGFFALLTPETQTKVNPNYVKSLSFTEKEALYKRAQEVADKLHKSADVVVCISHLGVDAESVGNQSYDVLKNTTGIDFVIDGHSHTVMEKGDAGEAIQSTGTEFANIGVIVLDNKTKKIESNSLLVTYSEDEEGNVTFEYGKDSEVAAAVKEVTDGVDAEYGETIATTTTFLDGVKENVRSQETNLGDLITDAMIWATLKGGAIEVDDNHIVAITNGGGIRANLEVGNISKANIKTVLPFGNTVAVNYITGAELLESLEASTYCTPETVGGFPQISGMNITIDTTKTFDQGDQYPDSTYYGPKSINRVTITDINGYEFDPQATYAVVTNNFCAEGGDTYYAFKRAYTAGKGFDLGIPLDEAVIDYIQATQNGTISDEYAEPQGRILIAVQ